MEHNVIYHWMFSGIYPQALSLPKYYCWRYFSNRSLLVSQTEKNHFIACIPEATTAQMCTWVGAIVWPFIFSLQIRKKLYSCLD